MKLAKQSRRAVVDMKWRQLADGLAALAASCQAARAPLLATAAAAAQMVDALAVMRWQRIASAFWDGRLRQRETSQ